MNWILNDDSSDVLITIYIFSKMARPRVEWNVTGECDDDDDDDKKKKKTAASFGPDA